MSVVAGPKAVPSVPVQVLRAALGTLTVAALVAGLVWGWGYAGPWASDRWARVFGDPSIRLAEGAVLPQEQAATSTLIWSSTSLLGSNDVALVARALGGPVEQLTAPESVAAAVGRGWTTADVGPIAAGTTWLRTASGVAEWQHAPLDGSGQSSFETPGVVVHGTGSLVAATASDRAALLRGWIDVLGATSGAAAPAIRIDTSERTVAGETEVQVWWRLASWTPDPLMTRGGASATTTASNVAASATFDAAGRLVQAVVWTRVLMDVRPVDARSASAVWDDLRHHRTAGDWASGRVALDLPVVADARLMPGTEETDPISGLSSAQPPEWWFVDEYGAAVFAQWATEAEG